MNSMLNIVNDEDICQDFPTDVDFQLDEMALECEILKIENKNLRKECHMWQKLYDDLCKMYFNQGK